MYLIQNDSRASSEMILECSNKKAEDLESRKMETTKLTGKLKWSGTEGEQSKIIGEFTEAGKACYLEIRAEKKSKVDVLLLNEGHSGHLDVKIDIEEDADVTVHNIGTTREAFTGKLTVNLNANKGSIKIRDLFIAKKGQYKAYVKVEHKGRGSISNILSRGISGSNALAEHRCLVNIGKDAAESRGKQDSRMLLLTETSKAKTYPRMVVRNDDVQCKHSSSISQIDQKKINYVMSRGVSRSDAIGFLLKGFCNQLMQDAEPELKKAGLRVLLKAIENVSDDFGIEKRQESQDNKRR